MIGYWAVCRTSKGRLSRLHILAHHPTRPDRLSIDRSTGWLVVSIDQPTDRSIGNAISRPRMTTTKGARNRTNGGPLLVRASTKSPVVVCLLHSSFACCCVFFNSWWRRGAPPRHCHRHRRHDLTKKTQGFRNPSPFFPFRRRRPRSAPAAAALRVLIYAPSAVVCSPPPTPVAAAVVSPGKPFNYAP